MPLQLSVVSRIEKNKLANDLPWIMLVEVVVSESFTVRLARNNEDVTWNGHTWIAYPMQIGDQAQDAKAVPQVSIQVSNVNRVMQSYLEQYKGLADCVVILRLVHAGHLDQAAEIEEEFNIQKTQYSDQWVTFTLGSNFFMRFRALSHRYLRDYCQFKYGRIECGVSAATLTKYPTCNHTLKACRERGNSGRFGGCPGMGGFFASNK